VRSLGAAAILTGLSCIVTAAASANGRLRVATGLAIHPSDERQLLLGLTYGLALSRDRGASWTWMCEQQIEGNGGDVDPSIVMTGDGTLVVLSLTNGGVLVSRDDGCSFDRATGPVQSQRGVDLTLDPSRSARVLALMSSLVEVTDGEPRYRNVVAQSLDHGASWDLLAELPGDFLPETLEIAPSDTNRIYVSGATSASPREGVVERSDDGGLSWARTTMELPFGSGSLYISGIHPTNRDRLWFRVPGWSDVYGVLPARLLLSTDGAASFEQVGDTQGGMLGFAVSPDGDRIVFGGPLDGLFEAPSDASAPPSRVSRLGVTCARWRSDGLYVCGLEPASPFGLGIAADPARDFAPLWQRASTCRDACAPPSFLEMRCREPWKMIAPLIDAGSPLCEESLVQDAGMVAERDAGSVLNGDAIADAALPDAGLVRPARGCAVANIGSAGGRWSLAAALVLAARQFSRPSRGRQRRS
jgi:hypothetical protein